MRSYFSLDTAEPVSRDQILRRERRQGENHFLFSDDHKEDWKPHPVDPQSDERADHKYTVFSVRLNTHKNDTETDTLAHFTELELEDLRPNEYLSAH